MSRFKGLKEEIGSFWPIGLAKELEIVQIFKFGVRNPVEPETPKPREHLGEPVRCGLSSLSEVGGRSSSRAPNWLWTETESAKMLSDLKPPLLDLSIALLFFELLGGS